MPQISLIGDKSSFDQYALGRFSFFIRKNKDLYFGVFCAICSTSIHKKFRVSTLSYVECVFKLDQIVNQRLLKFKWEGD